MKLNSLHSPKLMFDSILWKKQMLTYKRLATLVSTTLLLVGFAPSIALQAHAKELEVLDTIHISKLTLEEDRSAEDLGGVVTADCPNLDNPLICFIRGGRDDSHLEPEISIDSDNISNSADPGVIQIFEIQF